MEKILFVGAHPDDIEINAGGWISNICSTHAQDVFCMVMTGGGLSVPDCPVDSQRAIETREALEYLGVNESQIFIFNFPDTNVRSKLSDMIGEIDNLVEEFSIDTLITHFHADSHQDHRAVSEAVIASSRRVSNLIHFQPTNPSAKAKTPFDPNFIVRLTEFDIEKKLRALAFHKSQLDKYGNVEWFDSVRDVSKGDAWKVGGFHGYAELYQINRLIV